MSQIRTRLSYLYRRQGIGAVVKRIAYRAVRCVFETNSAFWFSRDLGEPLVSIQPQMQAKVDFHKGMRVLSWLKEEAGPYVYNQKEVGCAIENEHLFPCVFHGGKIVAALKLGIGRVYIADYNKILPLKPGYAFIYDTYVVPEYRGRHIAGYLVTQTLAYLKQQGFKTVGCHIPAVNAVSQRTYTHAGFKKTSFVRHIRIGGLLGFEIKGKEKDS